MVGGRCIVGPRGERMQMYNFVHDVFGAVNVRLGCMGDGAWWCSPVYGLGSGCADSMVDNGQLRSRAHKFS